MTARPVFGCPDVNNPPLSLAVQRDTFEHMTTPKTRENTATTAAEILTAIIHTRDFPDRILSTECGLAVLRLPQSTGCGDGPTGGGADGFWELSGGRYGFDAGWG